MASDLWLDTNPILRYVLSDDDLQAAAVEALLERAAQGEVRLHIPPLVLAECVWVLRAAYKTPYSEVSNALLQFCALTGVQVEDEANSLSALRTVGRAKVDFADAYLAALALTRGWGVATFDGDFRKLGCAVVTPR